jgi:hypothetical protein
MSSLSRVRSRYSWYSAGGEQGDRFVVADGQPWMVIEPLDVVTVRPKVVDLAPADVALD